MNIHSRTQNSARNLVTSIVQKVIAILLTFVGRQIFLQVLTVEYLGISGLFVDILSMLSLADLGLATAMAYSFYKPLAEKDEDKLAALTGFYSKVYRLIATFVAVVGLALTPFLGYIINLQTDIPNIEIYYLITLANTVVSYLFVYRSAIITADQYSSVVTKYAVGMNILRLLIQIAILLLTGSFLLYCLVSVFTTLAYNLLISRKADKLYPFIKRKVKLAATDKRDVFNNIKSIFIFKLAHVIYKGTDSLFISIILNTAIVGMYANYRLAVTNLSFIAFMVFGSLIPSIGNLVAREPPEKRMRVFRVMQTASHWLSGFFVFCLFFLLDDFVTLWLGKEFVFDFFTKIAILISFYTSITIYPVIAFRDATGMYQKTKYIMVAAVILKIIFSISLGIYIGLAGIILATFLSRALTYAWYEPKVLFRDFLSGNASSYFIGHIVNFAMLAACIALTYLLIPFQEVTGWLHWLIRGVLCTIGINAVYFLRYFKTKEFRMIVGKLKKLRVK